MTDIYYMQQALKKAHYAFDKGEIPIGAVVVCNDSIVARAHNLTERLKDVTAHAEIAKFTCINSLWKHPEMNKILAIFKLRAP